MFALCENKKEHNFMIENRKALITDMTLRQGKNTGWSQFYHRRFLYNFNYLNNLNLQREMKKTIKKLAAKEIKNTNPVKGGVRHRKAHQANAVTAMAEPVVPES